MAECIGAKLAAHFGQVLPLFVLAAFAHDKHSATDAVQTFLDLARHRLERNRNFRNVDQMRRILFAARGQLNRFIVAAHCCERLALARDDFAGQVSAWKSSSHRLQRCQRPLVLRAGERDRSLGPA